VNTLCGNNARLRALVQDWETPPHRETLSWMMPAG
ncbi:GDP-mannose 4,6 dehydratase, partial [Pseudomonas syringae pv. tagetis]